MRRLLVGGKVVGDFLLAGLLRGLGRHLYWDRSASGQKEKEQNFGHPEFTNTPENCVTPV